MEAEIIRRTSELLGERKVVSEEEVRLSALRAALMVFKNKLVDANRKIIDEVVESLIREPLTLNSLHYSEEVEINGVKLYHLHTHCPNRDEFEDAYIRCLRAREMLEKIELMKDITNTFFSGYTWKGDLLREYRREKYSYYIYYSSLNHVAEDIEAHKKIAAQIDGEYVVVIPTERDLREFLKFFRRYSEDVKKAGIKIWVANVEKRSIDPFIGYPKDFRLIGRFKNPKVATMVNSLWRLSVERID